MSRDVHLVGSIGLDTVAEVFSTVGPLLGGHLGRVPDGEPGGRRMWIGWQYPLLRASPFLEVDADAAGRTKNGFLPLTIAHDARPDGISFPELGYAREARASYLDFAAAREAGLLPRDIRFQVCLPTPFSVVLAACTRPVVPTVEAAYARAMMREVRLLCEAIPHRDLCIQWDICTEMTIFDGRVGWAPEIADFAAFLRERLARQATAIPADVELGYHLCYGDLDARHSIEPLDTAKLVAMANLIAGAAGRAIAYIHMPVPIARDDAAYFAPLADLRLGSETQLFLGLVHAADGVAGTVRRIEAAASIRPDFGIASECGISRVKTPDTVREILRIHAAAVGEPVAA
ncbi:MAG TPA: hypothetical protein VHD15_04785 [Hyphomicrobiales bacterium]|nr:hypothetical protein [Hyphomicrobiales bacterium]